MAKIGLHIRDTSNVKQNGTMGSALGGATNVVPNVSIPQRRLVCI